MSNRVSREELAEWVDQEGGLLDAIVGYGIYYDRLPEDAPRAIVEAWKRIEDVEPDRELINAWLQGRGD